MPIVRKRPLRAVGAHDQADRDARDHALPLGASRTRKDNADSASRATREGPSKASRCLGCRIFGTGVRIGFKIGFYSDKQLSPLGSLLFNVRRGVCLNHWGRWV